jgi:triphosphatase
VAIDASQTPVEAFRSIALSCLEHFQRNEPGLLAGGEAEFIHQARVALRRLRSAIKLFAPVLPPEFVAAYGQTWQTLAGSLGDARNWDVFLEETLPPMPCGVSRPQGRQATAQGRRKPRQSARKSVIGLLAVSEYPRLLLEFTAAIYTLGDTLPMPLTDFARQQIASHAKKARKLAEPTPGALPGRAPQDAHRFQEAALHAGVLLRRCCRSRRLKAYLAALSRLQDELGLINDQVTAETLLREALKGPARPGRSTAGLPGATRCWSANCRKL